MRCKASSRQCLVRAGAGVPIDRASRKVKDLHRQRTKRKKKRARRLDPNARTSKAHPTVTANVSVRYMRVTVGIDAYHCSSVFAIAGDVASFDRSNG